jgi:hypothetical protein
MWKKIAIALGVLFLLFVLVGLVLPTEYRLSRSIVIQAEPAKVHAILGDLKRWPEWGPWHDEDKGLVVTYGEKTAGVGASQSWTGDSGAGRLTITKSDPTTGVAFDLLFIEGESEIPTKGWLSYKPSAGATEVEWGMEGDADMPVIGGYFALCADLMIGGMFEKGLAKLKARAEAK